MSSSAIQRRRTARLKTQLRVQVVGVDEDFFNADGDISVGGVYLDTARNIGELGSVQRLRLATMRGTEQITLLARIARVATVNDFWRGQVVAGVAFQFMFQETTEIGIAVKTIPIERSWAIGEFVRCLARELDELEAKLDHVWQATLESSDGPRAATVNGVSLHGTVLETDFLVPVGELIRVEIPGPGLERIALVGRAVDSSPFAENEGKGFRTSVSFEPLELPADAKPATGSTIQDAFGALLNTPSTTAPVDNRPKQLGGDLSRVSLVSVLTLCDLERATGVLRLRGPLEEVRCYIHEGRLFDVERVGDAGDLTVEAVLAPVLNWPAGTFEFQFAAIAREDRIGMPTGALLLNLVHSVDEARRL